MAGAVGHDPLADVALSASRAAGVYLSRVAATGVPTGCTTICVDPAGRNQIAAAAGANALARAAQVEDAALGPGVAVVQMEVPPTETAGLVARARARGARTVLNPAPAGTLPGDALQALDLLVVNEQEAAWLAARLGCRAGAPALRAALGGGPDVAVTRGEIGAETATAAGTTRAPAFPVAAVDTAGAGDCWCGVLAAALDAGAPLEKARRGDLCPAKAQPERKTDAEVALMIAVGRAMAADESGTVDLDAFLADPVFA